MFFYYIKYKLRCRRCFVKYAYNVTQNVQCCDDFNSSLAICENANVIEKLRNPKKSPKILEIQDVSNILVKKITFPIVTEKTDNITYNMELDSTYSITKNNISLNTNETYITGNISNDTFVPMAESTLTEKLTSEYEIDHNNNESDTSIISKNNIDDSFHLSDCSTVEDTDEGETEDIHEYTINTSTNTSKNKIMDSTLNLTSSRSSKVTICDDRNMYVETSDKSKSKLNMCLYCKEFQTQFARHLESVHKNEEVKKFRFLPKSKLCVCMLCKVAKNT